CPALVELDVHAFRPSQSLQLLLQRLDAGLHLRIARAVGHQHADTPHSLGLLPARRERPSGSGAAEQRDELAASHHSMTSSASVSKLSEIVRRSALVVFRLMTKRNLVACWTGRSVGFAPLRIRPQ